MTSQFKQNLLAAYNEAIDNNRMTELVARQHITNKYGVEKAMKYIDNNF